ncbi:MAG: hypothetical protein KDD61_07135 [Bdellovibrionales bacterium]|nr:hypothetical protein [Bdellovibrionales bacterium]
MGVSTSLLLQSKFYSSAFNSAIFDGPVRIYFAQYQEEQALRIHYHLQRCLNLLPREAHVANRRLHRKIFVMLYPDHLSYIKAFPDERGEAWQTSNLGEDRLLGVQTPVADAKATKMTQLVQYWLQEIIESTDSSPMMSEDSAPEVDQTTNGC